MWYLSGMCIAYTPEDSMINRSQSYLRIASALLPHIITMLALLLAVNDYHPRCPPETLPSPTEIRKPTSWATHVSSIPSWLERLVNHL